jgi:outer membrane protein assembly factor BamA
VDFTRSILLLFLTSILSVQTFSQSAQWHLFVQNKPETFPFEELAPLDSMSSVSLHLIQHFQQKGYYYAKIARTEQSANPPAGTFYLEKGVETKWGSIELSGVNANEAETLKALMQSQEGHIADLSLLDTDFQRLLEYFEENGFLLAQIRIKSLRLSSQDSTRWQLQVRIEQGSRTKLAGFEIKAERMKPALLEKVLQIRQGEALRHVSLEEMRQSLENSALFESVEAVGIRIDRNGDAHIKINAKEVQAGNFDLALGYLPAIQSTNSSQKQRGSLVGNGALLLRNALGRGEQVNLKLNKLPSQVSRFEMGVSYPFVFGLPLKIAVKFDGYQRDSTYNQYHYDGEVGYKLSRHLEALATIQRLHTRPSGITTSTTASTDVIDRASSWFFGIGLRYESLDNRLNPRKGLWLQTNIEQGTKSRAIDATSNESIQRQRLQTTARWFIPVRKRQVLLFGNETRIVLGKSLDISEAYRFGGTSSMRGYNEEQFKGDIVGRVFGEYRYQLDATSFAFAFSDLGYVQSPFDQQSANGTKSQTWLNGFGVGFQYSTPLGLVSISYAINPQEGATNGRVHIGLSLGL